MKKDINKKNIVIVGNANSGKSTLFNSLINFEKSIVSDVVGTTTDPVNRVIEIIGFGAFNLIDTAGIDDISYLGSLRVKKTIDNILNSHLILYLISFDDIKKNNIKNNDELDNFINEIKNRDYLKNKKVIFIISKADLLDDKLDFNILKFSINNKEYFKDKIFNEIKNNLKNDSEVNLLEGILEDGKTALLVIPIDSEAPKGRLILPQVQTLRALCDKNITSIISSLSNLSNNIKKYNPDLVITDSKIFKEVADIVPKDKKLTSFSILFARQKGDIKLFYESAKVISKLKKGDEILIAESCVHTKNHEDIGNVLIPKLIKNKTGIDFKYTFSNGPIPDDISKFSLIIHCGGCMNDRLNMENRINKAKSKNIPITNYGIIISYLKGELERATF